MKRFMALSFFTLFLFEVISGNLFCQQRNQSLDDESGFFEIEPVYYYFHFQSYFNRITLTSSLARLWYTFQVADQDSDEKPLFIFFNGGPSCATCDGLMSMNTSRKTLDTSIENGGDEFVTNHFSWSRLGNLLYIDARTAGFSYNIMEYPENYDDRFREFGAQNFNSFIDAADFIRLLLDFLSRHPAIQKNPVIIVGESYGGIRSIVMLHILLNYRDYGNGNAVYQDEDLVQKIQAHYDEVFPEYENKPVPPEVIATQFGYQILIQPAISMCYQHLVTGEMFEKQGSLIYQVAEDEGVEYVPCSKQNNIEDCDPVSNAFEFIDSVAHRDLYNCSKPRDWLFGFFYKAARLIRFVENLSLLTGVNISNITEFYAYNRSNAYKLYDTQHDYNAISKELPVIEKLKLQSLARTHANRESGEPGDMNMVFGNLNAWDRYFISCNSNANWAFYFNVALYRGYDINFRSSKCYGRMFLKNVAFVKTFITNAKYDLVIYSNAIPRSLALHNDIIQSSIYDKTTINGEERPGRIILKYKPNAFPDIGNLNIREIRFPFYKISCHAVSVTEPEELFLDVFSWLAENGMLISSE